MKYIAPKLSANDDQLKVSKLYFNNGDFVKKGEIIADLESTKIAHEIIADNDKKIYYYFKEGDIINVGETLAEQSNDVIDVSYDNNIEPIFTKAALKLIQKNNLNKDLFISKKIVQSEDVHEILTVNEQINNSVTHTLNEKYPLLNEYKYIPVASIEFEYECNENDNESSFWKKLFDSDLSQILNAPEIHNFVYNGKTLYLYPIRKSTPVKNYRSQLNNAVLETFRGNVKIEKPIICVSFLKSNINFKHTPLLYKDSIITIGVAEIISKKNMKVNICYDHRFIDGYTILKIIEKF